MALTYVLLNLERDGINFNTFFIVELHERLINVYWNLDITISIKGPLEHGVVPSIEFSMSETFHS